MNMKDPIASDESGGFRRNVPRRSGGHDDEGAEGRKPGRSRRKSLPPIPEEYVPVIEERPAELPERKEKNDGKMEGALLADGWEMVEGDRSGGKVRGPASDRAPFSEIVEARKEILEKATYGPDPSDTSLGSRISGEAFQELADLRRVELAKKIDDIASDPTKNSKRILEELTAMKNESNPTPVSVPEKVSDPDASIIADTLSKIDAVRAENGRRNAGKPEAERKPKNVPFSEVKEYLSELILSQCFRETDGGLSGDAPPKFSLGGLMWRDGRRLHDVLSPKAREKTIQLLRDIESELEVIHKFDRDAEVKKISGEIDRLFSGAYASISSLKSATSMDDVEATEFSLTTKRMNELGFRRLPKPIQAVFMKRRHDISVVVGRAEREARKRLSSIEHSDQDENLVVSEPSIKAAVDDPNPIFVEKIPSAVTVPEGAQVNSENMEKGPEALDFEEVKRRAKELVERQFFATLGRIEEAERTEDAEALHSLRHLGWRVSSSAVERLVGALDDERKAEIREMIREMNHENGILVRERIDGFFLGLAKEAPNTRKLYWALDQMPGFGPIDGKEADGKAWRKKLARLGQSAFRMSDEEFDRGDWGQEIPEPLRETFPKLIRNWRESAKEEEWIKTLKKRVGEKPEIDETAIEAEWNEKQAVLDSERRGDDHARTDSAENFSGAATGTADRSSEGMDISDRMLADESAEKTARDALMAEARGRAEESITNTPEVMHSRRGGEKAVSVGRVEFLEKNRERTGLEEKISLLKASVSEKEAHRAELEMKRNRQREEHLRLSDLRVTYEKRFKNIFLKPFTDGDRLGQFAKEEERAKKELEKMDAEWMQKNEELKRLHAELSEAIHDLEELTGEEGLSDAFARESVAKAYGRPLEDIGEVVHGDNGDDSEEKSDPFIKAVEDGVAVPEGDTVSMNEWSGKGIGKNSEKAGSGAGKELPKEKRKIYPGVPELFKREFGIFEDDLKKVEGFDRLSWGQQRLVFENLKQLTLGRIQEEAIDRADKDAKENKWASGTNWIRKGWKAASRKYQIAEAEKKTAEEIVHGGLAVHGEILKQLVEGAKSGPEVEYDPRTSELNIHFASGRQFAHIPEGERGALDAFNAAADVFSRTPAEWRYKDSAKKENYDRYKEAEKNYENAKDELRDFFQERYSKEEIIGEDEMTWIINDLDGKVRMTQFFQTTKDAEKQFLSIRNDAAWTRMWKDSVTEHGLSFVLGIGARTAAAAGAGFLATPLLPAVLAGAGLVGGVRAYIRSKEQIKEKDRRSRKGRGEEKDPTVKRFSSEELSTELSGLADASLDSFGEKDQEEKVLQLRKSLDVIRKKMESGMVDFGTEKESSGNEYELLSALSRASAVIAMYSADESSEFQMRFKEAVESNDEFIEGETARTKKKRAIFVGKNILKGAALSATFAGLGYGARYAVEHGSSILSSVSDRLTIPDDVKKTMEDAFGASGRDASPSLPEPEPTGEPRPFFKSTAEPTESPTEVMPESEPSVPVTPNPDRSPLPEEDWNASSGDGGLMNASYQVPEDHIPDEGNPLSRLKETVSPRPVESAPVGSGTGVGAGELHGRVSSVGVIRPGISPEQQAAIQNANSPVADPEGVSPETQAVIAEQEAAERATLEAESVSGRADTREVSKAVSDAWNDNVERAKIGTGDDRFGLAEKVRPETTLDSKDVGVVASGGAADGIMEEGRAELDVEKTSTVAGAELNPLSAAEKADVDLGITYETERVDPVGETAEGISEGAPEVAGSADEAIPTGTSPMQEDVRSDWKGFVEDRNMVKSDEVRGYLMAHPEHVEVFRKSLADYDASIFEAAHGGTGMRGVANMAELGDKVAAKQVMYDCLKLLRDPLTPTYEIRTYQLANSLNFDQMQNVGEFMMKASERFGKGAFPIGDESLRGYIERMTALLAERGETVKLNGDMRLLKQLAFQGFKR